MTRYGYQPIKWQHYSKEMKRPLVAVLGRTVKAQEALTSDDALNLVEVVSDYAYALDTLDKYDYQQLAVEQTTNEAKFRATYEGKVPCKLSNSLDPISGELPIRSSSYSALQIYMPTPTQNLLPLHFRYHTFRHRNYPM